MKILNLVFLVSLVACSTQSLRVESTYETPTGTKGKFTYQNSYDLASYPWLCGFTAIFWGGACWVYLAMPMVPQQQALLNDAKAALEKDLGTTDVKIAALPVEVERTKWGVTPMELKVEGEGIQQEATTTSEAQ